MAVDLITFNAQVLHIRSSSKFVIWLHVEQEAGARIEVIGKHHQEASAELLTFLRHSVNVGDVISITGFWDPVGTVEKPILHAIAAFSLKKFSGFFQPIAPAQKLQVKSVDCCKFWVNTGDCQFKNACSFSHPTGLELKIQRKAWVENRRAKRALDFAAKNPNDLHLEKGSNAARSNVFSTWLVHTFGINESKSLLDIAGGRGIISIQLWLEHRVKSTIIDPRDDCARPSKQQLKAIKALGQDFIMGYSHTKAWFNADFPLNYASLWENAAVIFGMHPDQATELIIDMALAHSKPFAVVPCCVFARESPHRKTGGGQLVATYEQFIQYLLKKSPFILSCYLPFEGRNLVLYSLGHAAI